MTRKLILKTFLSPGDICTLTAAIESLHTAYPGQYLTDVRTACDDIFVGNPRISRLSEQEAEMLDMHYTDLICQCDQVPNSFLRGYCDDLGKKLGIPLELTTNRPHLYLTAEDHDLEHPLAQFEDRSNLPYWLVTAGVKRDFTTKQWPIEYYQAVVDELREKVRFVQIGSSEHDHVALDGVINLLGKTNTRELIRLVYHSSGGLGPVTLLQHLCAAFQKPYVALLGGREPISWTQYPLQTTLHTLGKLPCCQWKSCWRSRVVRMNDGSDGDQSLCDMPVLGMKRAVGRCMTLIAPVEVVSAIAGYQANATWESSPSPPAKGTPRNPLGDIGISEKTDAPFELIAYSAWGFETKIVPATTARAWMDATGEKFAYHCLPMVLANQSGWFILAPHGIVAEWNGGMAPKDLQVRPVGSPSMMLAMSQVGSGILTWTIPYVFRTPPGWNLLCRGPANFPKDGLCPLEGLVETDWSFASFSMNWKLTRPGTCSFNPGEPIAMLVPNKRRDLESFAPRLAPLDENPRLRAGYETWNRSRHEFWERQKRGDPQVLKQKYEKHYFRGVTNHGEFFPDHQKARTLAPFSEPPAEINPVAKDEQKDEADRT